MLDSSPKGGALGKTANFVWTAKASPRPGRDVAIATEWGMRHCVSNDGEVKDADGIRKKPIDKSHKKRYILFINALKKSVHCICRSESRKMLRIRYGRAVCCHFGAGAVS